MRGLVEAATSRLGEPRWRTAVRCIGGDGPTSCDSPIEVTYDGVDSIVWSCTAGCGETGVITGFVGSQSDLSVFVTLGPEVTWEFDESEYELLRTATRALPELRGTIIRAELHAEIAGRVVVKATPEELEDIDMMVAHLAEATRGGAKLEILRGITRSLSAALQRARPGLRGS